MEVHETQKNIFGLNENLSDIDLWRQIARARFNVIMAASNDVYKVDPMLKAKLLFPSLKGRVM